MYLKKQITTGHGYFAECWVIKNVTTNGDEANGYSCNGSLTLYKDKAIEESQGRHIDNCTFSYSGFTQANIEGNTPLVIMQKIMESVLNEEEEETNTLRSSFSGLVGFQNAEVI